MQKSKSIAKDSPRQDPIKSNPKSPNASTTKNLESIKSISDTNTKVGSGDQLFIS